MKDKFIPSEEELREKLETMTLQQIADWYGVSYSRVFNWTAEYSINLKPVKPSKEKFEEYYTTHTPKETAEHFNTTTNTIRVWAISYNLLTVTNKEEARKQREEKQKQAIELYNKNMELREIADALCVSKNTIAIWLNDAGVRERKKITKRPSRKELEEKYQTLTLRELAEHYNIPVATAKNWIQTLKLHKDAKGRQGRPAKNPAYLQHPDFIEYYSSHTTKDTAKHYGITTRTAREWAKKYGVYVPRNLKEKH